MSAISGSYSEYAQRLPQGMAKAVGASFLISFTSVSIISGGNVLLGLGAGTFASIACLIDSCLRPLLANAFGNLSDLSQYCLRTAVILSLSALVGPLCGIALGVIHAIFLAIISSPIVDCIMGWPEDPARAQGYIIV
ncbi:MAG TPA: hypothetical protein VGJ00_08515 [Rhabdochlamydiaceae bacterium]|jgi:hypothetical protein